MTNNSSQNEGRDAKQATQAPGKPQMGDAQQNQKNPQAQQDEKNRQAQQGQQDSPAKQPDGLKNSRSN